MGFYQNLIISNSTNELHYYRGNNKALPVPADTTSSEFNVRTFSGGRYYKTTLQVSYEFLKLAWYQAYSHLQMLKIKPVFRHASLEVYEVDPATVSHTNELITSIYTNKITGD